jgi:hypothetical protein
MGPISVMLVWYYSQIVKLWRKTYTVNIWEGCEIPCTLKHVIHNSVEFNAVPHLHESVLGIETKCKI